MTFSTGGQTVSVDLGNYPLYVGMAEAVRLLGLSTDHPWRARNAAGDLLDPETPGAEMAESLAFLEPIP